MSKMCDSCKCSPNCTLTTSIYFHDIKDTIRRQDYLISYGCFSGMQVKQAIWAETNTARQQNNSLQSAQSYIARPMNNFRKIRQLNEEKAEKVLAMTQLAAKKSKNSSESSFVSTTSRDENQKIEDEQNKIYFIKNLDNNKIEMIDQEDKVDRILEQLDVLPEIEKALQKIWTTYSSEHEKEEEMFLEACYQGNVGIVQKVVASKSKHPIDPKNSLTDEGKNGIHLATVSGSYRNVEIISVLVKVGVDINGRTHNEKRTPLMLGSILGNDIAVKALVDSGAEPDLQDYEGNTALHLACGYNQEKIVEILLNKCSTDISNNKGQKPIECISCSETTNTLKPIETISYSKRTNVANTAVDEVTSSNSQQKDEIDNLLDKIRSSYMKVESNKKVEGREEKINQVPIDEIKQIGLSSFKKLSILGKGAFGEVYLVENLQDGQKYAMKVLDKATIMRQNILRYAMTEKKILSTINHPFVVRLYYALQSTEKLYLVMQYCPGGDLLRLIKKKGKLSEEETKKFVTQVLLAIEQLHKAQIIYRDLKPGNVVLDPQGHACLTDFGLSKQAALSHSFCGSTAYLAPEMLWRRGHTKVLDWYLLGVFIYECLTGRPPFWDTNKEQLLANIKSGRYKQLGNEYSREVKDLIENLLRSNSSKRLGVKGASEIKSHPWFKDVNWASVLRKEQSMEKMEPLEGKPIKDEKFTEPEFVHNKVSGWDFRASTTSQSQK